MRRSAWVVAVVLVLACSSAESRAPGTVAPSVATREAASVSVAAATATATAVAPVAPRVRVALVGDLMLARDIATLMETLGPGHPFERVAPLLADADLRIGNLEGTFTERGFAQAKQYTFRTPPALVEGLALAGFDAVSLANNHTLDFGDAGLKDTIVALEGAGIARAGAGGDSREARQAAVLEAPGARVALVSVNTIPGSAEATRSRPGVAWADEAALVAIEAARASADFVVVMVHWGTEYSSEPTAEQRAFGRAAIEAGADVVAGHHPHVLQPWERYRDGLILYSLGNFVFDLDGDDLATLGTGPFATVVAMVTLEEGVLPALELRAVFIDPLENRPRPATEAERALIEGSMFELRSAGSAP